MSACAAEKAPHELMTVVREAAPLAEGKAQRERLCGRGGQDLVLDLFCTGDEPPEITGLMPLMDALGVGPVLDQSSGFAMTGHSTSLSARSVSAINPRLIFVRPQTPSIQLLSLAFARGEQFAEILARDRVTKDLRFYLVSFKQDCNDREQGCTPGDLLTPAVESGWKDLDVYAEEDLANTPFDCNVCHQPDGPGTPKMLRMQELQPPWNHWFYPLSDGGQALLRDYLAAKGDEPFAGISGEQVFNSNPGLLSSTLYFSGSGAQPNEYISATIEAEVTESAAAKGGNQPMDNSVPGSSPTWEALYERAQKGEAISVPYHDVKVTDPDKLAAMTQAYTDYREGRMDAADLPDIRDIYPDDPALLANMGFTTREGLSPKQVLVQACAQCHNDRLDQSVSRARFHLDLDRLDREEKDQAIARLLLPEDNPQHMPPRRFKSLSDETRDQLIELLQQ